MKNITYGYVVIVLMLLTSFIFVPIVIISPTAGFGLFLISFIAMHAWWIKGFFAETGDEFMGGLIKKDCKKEN